MKLKKDKYLEAPLAEHDVSGELFDVLFTDLFPCAVRMQR